MAIITASSITGSNAQPVTVTVLGASDTFSFDSAKNPVLVLNNVTAGALTPLIDGADSTTQPCSGIGNIDVSAGLTLASIGIGATVAIPLNSISAYLKGVITITGGDAIEAQLLEF